MHDRDLIRFLRRQIFVAWLTRDHHRLNLYRARLSAYRYAQRLAASRRQHMV